MDPSYHRLSNVGQPPPLNNPPPQIFGGYPPGNPTMGPSFADQFLPEDYGTYNYDDLGDDGMGDDGQGDPKRRRIARACDMCRKKKIKCDGKMPKCSHCENYKTHCVFTQVEKKRQPPKGAKYIEGLENRLGRMEGLLRMSGLLAEDDGGKTDLGTLEKRLADRVAAQSGSTGSASETGMTPQARVDASASSRQPTPQASAISSPQSAAAVSPKGGAPQEPRKKSAREVEALADQMCSLVTNNIGETGYIGGFAV